MHRFFKTTHVYVDRIFPRRRLSAVSLIHSPAEITNRGLLEPILHPWPEWSELMELLLKKGYFGEAGSASKGSNRIRTSCLNFARHHFDLVRYLSREDMKVIARCGCPSVDRKVVNSGKRLRAHLGIGEGDVCGSCNLRGECERAYVEVREEGARTVDVMRILLTYGLDYLPSTVENRICRTKFVEDSVRKLLREIVEYSSMNVKSVEASRKDNDDEKDVLKRPKDWQCPQCKFLNFARNLKCLGCSIFSEERLQQLKEEQKDHLPLKKGDWICETCNFLNFAKNTRCLRCREKPPRRELNPGATTSISEGTQPA
ncbi:PREDICTED: zinc finger protein VAR3, chloroplastic isoform X2 [Tarenaya hassleriana]|uniref:zinc finger protein VAR3, chloroplastic isoform X2 n=1 Tax=Tarenaya hassleriana TaxID=28532 RepID=UPI0008FD707B|nr:PREDICTED: zinc finger protein VAR3, chloroplastic isoform X2 [Tarenaya hassleriana]